MLQVYACITDQHEIWLVLLAGAVCLFASYTAFSLVARARTMRRLSRVAWLAAAAVATGGGVWATHFIAMLAYAAGLPVGYDVGLTAASVAIAIAVSGAGLLAAVIGRAPAIGGAIVGIGIAMMHYVGMAALEVPAIKQWDLGYVHASVLIGLIGGAGAFLAAERGPHARPAAAVLLALTICGLHFTAMAAFSLAPDPRLALPDRVMAPDWLAVAVAAATMLIVAFGLLGAVIDERLAQRSLEEAERLRRYVADLEATKRDLEATSGQLELALEAASAGSQAKSQFLAAMSHELRTPLNAIIGFAELMTGKVYGPLGDGRYEGYAQTIVDSGHHLLSLINDVLDFSKVDAGHLELQEASVDPATLVAETTRVMDQQADRAGVRIVTVVPDGLPCLIADQRRLRQVLLNLLSNAIKFTPEGGTVQVAVSHGPAGMTVTVADTGIGIAAEDIPRALDSFGQIDSRLTRRYDGTGLGLPLSKRLVELHGGTLSIESAVGAGTTVTVAFPPERTRPRAVAA